MKDVGCKVYFARCIGPNGLPIGAYKIGASYGHNERIKRVAISLPFTLELAAVTPGSTIMEAICHVYLREYCVGGEYFRECPEVNKFVARVAATGSAFHYISDSGYDRLPDASIDPFMAYHGVTSAEVGDYLKRPADKITKLRKSGHRSRNIIGAAALIAASRRQYVRWPDDLIAALRGEVYHSLAPDSAEAAE